MGNYILLILFVFALPGKLLSQEKYDNKWLLGYDPNRPNDGKNGGTMLDFVNGGPDTVYYDIAFDLTVGNSQICKKDGSPLLYSNGCEIAQFPDHVLENSDGLNPDVLRDIWCDHKYYDMDQGFVTLPWPGREDEYALFHLAWKRYQQFPTIDRIDKFYYTHINMKANDGAGIVLEKNQLILLDTFEDNLTAVRHGNGRDWWLVQPRRGTDTMFLFLFQPDGIKGPFVEKTGLRMTNDLYVFGQAVFSPDGTRYIKVCHEDGVDVLSFDRCKGKFSCPLRLPFPKDPGGPSGAGVSPSGHFLYVSARTELYQYDLWAKDIESTKTLIAEYDGFHDPGAATFYQQMLAPNGKIYMTATNSQRYLHVIHQPDSAGLACDFRQHDLRLPTYNGFTLPNFPNFRLYDLPYSPCDTAGVDAPPGYAVRWTPSDGIRLLRNPTSGYTTVTLPPCADGRLSVYTTTGVLLEEHRIRCEKSYELDCSQLPAGMYVVAFAPTDGGRPLPAKLVVAR